MLQVKWEPTATPMGADEERAILPGTPQGVPLVSGSFRYCVAITPGASQLAHHIDGFYLTADANVTLASADDPSTTVGPIAMKAGTEYRIACSKITAVSAGTLIGCYHRKP